MPHQGGQLIRPGDPYYRSLRAWIAGGASLVGRGGLAGLLELARLVAERAPPVDVELVAYALEEPPYFASEDMGSRHHARDSDAVLTIVLEMIGYFDDALDGLAERHIVPFSDQQGRLHLQVVAVGGHVVQVGDLRQHACDLGRRGRRDGADPGRRPHRALQSLPDAQ